LRLRWRHPATRDDSSMAAGLFRGTQRRGVLVFNWMEGVGGASSAEPVAQSAA
jgi:hypothetical protein